MSCFRVSATFPHPAFVIRRGMKRFEGLFGVGITAITSVTVCVSCLSTSGGGGSNSESSSKSPSGQPSGSSSECDGCTSDNCGSQQDACDSASGCSDVLDCVLGCGVTDVECKLDCANQGANLSNDALMAGNQLQTCLATSCAEECWSTSTVGAPSSTPNPSTGAAGSIGSAQCQSCSEGSCSAQRSACDQAAGCSDAFDCASACSPTDGDCLQDCSAAAAGLSQEAQLAGSNYSTCLVSSCGNECFGADLGDLPTSPSTNPTTPPAASTPSEPSGPGVPPATGQLVSGTNWLSFDGDWADASAFPNGDLNISGSMYAFGDDCATLNWDPVSRCVSGELCDPGPDFANWGISVGFDFHNTGEEGSPPNAKKTWDAAAAGAVGVAWTISGSAPSLQAWITNMAPSHGGVCTVDACDISGPPDGDPAASTSGELYFSSLRKDDWGGSGTDYTFDPAAILALQFKLPAVKAGATSYSFCVDAVGIIR